MSIDAYRFVKLGEDEKILKVLHRNWFYLATQLFIVGALAAALFGGGIMLTHFYPTYGDAEDVRAFFESLFMLFLWLYAFLVWIDYYFDIWIITDRRIINVEQKGLFIRRVSELYYEKVQDVTTDVKGFLPTIINYGDVIVQTAGEEDNFLLRTVSDPYQIKSLIAEQQRTRARKGSEQLSEMIGKQLNGTV